MGNDFIALTEAGLSDGAGNLITEGRIVDIAREAKALYESLQYGKFTSLMDSAINELSARESAILLGVPMFEDGDGFIEKLADLELPEDDLFDERIVLD